MQTLVYRSMQNEIRIVVVSIVLVVAFSASGALAQQPQSKCSQGEYSERMTNARPYRLKGIEGQVIYGDVSEKGEFQAVSNVCVALFNRKDKRLVANVPTASGGQFKFGKLARGSYVLILSLSSLHGIVIPVRVDDSPGAKAFKRWGLMLHLRSREDRKKSFVTPISQLLLREELLTMGREDQAIRNQMIRPELALQQAMLPRVRRSYESGNLSAWNYALLLDRVLTREGKPQVYGMALDHWAAKEPVLYPIEDEANVDKRRAKIGLPPLREYLEFMKRLYFP